MMSKALRDASIDGNVSALHQLLQTDPLILDRQITDCYTETPLHISTMRGHVSFTKEILAIQPEMAAERSSPQKSTPLHLASAKGYLEIVKMLLVVNPEMCYASDTNGRNPLHVAVIKGRIDVLKELVLTRPLAVRASVEEGDTILHLCVKYNQVDALKVLVEKCIIAGISDDGFVNSKNHDGNTILHLAVADKHIEIVKYILSLTEVEVNAKNAYGYTALDISAQSRRDMNDMLISESLQLVGGSRSIINISCPPYQEESKIEQADSLDDFFKQQNSSWVEKKRDSIMVVSILIATMAFAAGTNPPGGVWQDNNDSHIAGTSVMADNRPDLYKTHLIYNTTSFVTSLSIIVLLASALVRRRLFMWVLLAIMWISISTLALSYLDSIIFLSHSRQKEEAVRQKILDYAVIAWTALLFLALSGITIHFIRKLVRRLAGTRRKRFMWVLIVITWISLFPIGRPFTTILSYFTFAWFDLLFILLLGHAIRIIVKLVRRLIGKTNRTNSTIVLGSV